MSSVRRGGAIGRARVLVVVVAALSVVALAGLAPAASSVRAAAPERYRDQVFDQVTVTRDLVYQPAAGLALDVYEPMGDPADERPVLVWMHGVGAGGVGSKSDPLEREVSTRFAKHGVVVASIDYRFYGPRADDARAAVAWLRAHATTYRIDVDRVVLTGASAGAITALEAAYGPDITVGEPPADQRVDAIVSIQGADPVSAIQAGEPPVFMAHGTEDLSVPYADAVATCDAAEAAGVACEFHSYPTDHPGLVRYIDELEHLAFAWLYEVLDLASAPDPSIPTTTIATTTTVTTTTRPTVPPTAPSPADPIPAEPDYAG